MAIHKCPSSPAAEGVDPFHRVGAAAGDYGSINEVKRKVYTDVLGVNDPAEPAWLGLQTQFVDNPISTVADGTTHFINDSIDVRTFVALCTRAGGEIVGEF